MLTGGSVIRVNDGVTLNEPFLRKERIKKIPDEEEEIFGETKNTLTDCPDSSDKTTNDETLNESFPRGEGGTEKIKLGNSKNPELGISNGIEKNSGTSGI
ncbi:hypothetical protein K0M31_019329 [Melipona bicolor]|uniref:Uncharacterized protein n=1 Tax=Melipona bicolor TaxID=60889 RepID=A0AA40KR14_9HYME|nr:hypothetical protein K0M31_019329 [Melipona bicolor]